ncbi:MAG: adenylosuccinate lyase, partial [Oscillospiraceae bacterium]|nr:adenylosuccinate lyase [Oscillospiraceae bacterium]
RISIPEAFLAVDAILSLYINLINGITVYPKMMERHLFDELPFMATETILMYCVKEKDGDRQTLHEAIREHSVSTAKEVKLYGAENNLLNRIANDPRFGLTMEEIQALLPFEKFTGRAKEQTEEFLSEYVQPTLEKHAALLGIAVSINV